MRNEQEWTKVNSCPACGKSGEAGAQHDISGKRVPDAYRVVHKVSDGSHSGLVTGEIMESCGLFTRRQLEARSEEEE